MEKNKNYIKKESSRMSNLKELFSEFEPLPIDVLALLSEEDKEKCAAMDIDTEEIMKRVLGDEYIEPDEIREDMNKDNNKKTR